ncbi:MAG: AAA family ATPase, partial [Solirubrobacteraceae bacterium]
MLLELRVENLLLIERAELELGPGLNVVTGETGAGKSVLAHALDLLLGAKPRSGIVRPGAKEAWVEAVFRWDGDRAQIPPELADRLPADEDELVLARRVSAEGRSRAFIGGRSATAADLQELGPRLLAFHGQHASRRLLSPAAQLSLLDGFAEHRDPGHGARRTEHAAAHATERDARSRLEQLRTDAGARERELDLLRYELGEIDDVDPREDEQTELRATRERLRHVEALRTATWTASTALGGDDGSAGSAIAAAEGALDGVAGIDAGLDATAERVRALRIEADDVAAEL